MIVEFIGSTGAGKTTLMAEVQSRLAGVADVTISFDLCSPFRSDRITNRMARNFVQEIAVLPVFLRTLRKNRAAVAFTLQMLKRQAAFSTFTINNLRGIERQIGVLEKVRRAAGDRIVLVDEGTVHLAHKVFVFSRALYAPDEIARFTDFIPLPDLLVYLKAPVETLVRRTLERPDPPREIRKNRAMTAEYIRRAVATFEQIVKVEKIQRRLLIVENPDLSSQELKHMADQVAGFILDFRQTGAISISESWKNNLPLERSLIN